MRSADGEKRTFFHCERIKCCFCKISFRALNYFPLNDHYFFSIHLKHLVIDQQQQQHPRALEKSTFDNLFQSSSGPRQVECRVVCSLGDYTNLFDYFKHLVCARFSCLDGESVKNQQRDERKVLFGRPPPPELP